MINQNKINSIDFSVSLSSNIEEYNNNNIVIDVIVALAYFLTESAKKGKELSELKGSLKNILNWGKVAKILISYIPAVLKFYNIVIKNSKEFVKQIDNITKEQQLEIVEKFALEFDLDNDKAEQVVENSIAAVLEVIVLIKYFNKNV